MKIHLNNLAHSSRQKFIGMHTYVSYLKKNSPDNWLPTSGMIFFQVWYVYDKIPKIMHLKETQCLQRNYV